MPGSFCVGGAMIMGGNGLQLTGVDAGSDCLMLWTEALTVNSAARAVVANVGVALLAIVAQYLTTTSSNRIQRSKHAAKLKRAAILVQLEPENGTNHAIGYNTSSTSSSSSQDIGNDHNALVLPLVSDWEHFGDSVLHGCRIFVAYLLMLAAMTYDIALISSTVVGFVFGYYIFTKDSTKVPESADPCCS